MGRGDRGVERKCERTRGAGVGWAGLHGDSSPQLTGWPESERERERLWNRAFGPLVAVCMGGMEG